jgi:hypothetical protein
MPQEDSPEKNPPTCAYTPTVSLWLLACTLALIGLGLASQTLWSLALIIPTFFLFLLSLLRPPGSKEKTKKELAQRLQKAGLGYKEEPSENFWSKRTFNDE